MTFFREVSPIASLQSVTLLSYQIIWTFSTKKWSFRLYDSYKHVPIRPFQAVGVVCRLKICSSSCHGRRKEHVSDRCGFLGRHGFRLTNCTVHITDRLVARITPPPAPAPARGGERRTPRFPLSLRERGKRGRTHRGGFFDGWRSNAIRRDRLLPVRADVFRIRTPCGRAEAGPYEKNLPVRGGRGEGVSLTRKRAYRSARL